MLVVIVFLVALLAFANGANDNGKGVATLVGFGAASVRQALAWALITTAAGAVLSFWFAGGLIKSFSAGLFADGTPVGGPFFAAVLIGAIGWVAFATYTGMPVSTTHAITGGLVGAGLTAFSSSQIRWQELGTKVGVPLAVSPVLSTVLVYVLALPVAAIARRSRIPAEPVDPISGEPMKSGFFGTALHWATSGLVGFARGWNDAPKIAALTMGALTTSGVANAMAIAFAVVTFSMALGGILAGRRVLEMMATKLTPLPLAESLTASTTTAALVSAASWAGLPVSTTHVSTGAIIGAGLANDPKEVKWGKVRDIVVSWLVTLPVAAMIAAAAKWLMPH